MLLWRKTLYSNCRYQHKNEPTTTQRRWFWIQNKIYWKNLHKHTHTHTFTVKQHRFSCCRPSPSATISLWRTFASEFHKCGWIGNRSLQINIWIQVLWFTPMWVCSHAHVCVCVWVCVWVCVRLPRAVLVGPMPDSLLSGIWWGLVMFYMHSSPCYIMNEAHLPSKRQNNRGWDIRRTDTKSCACVLLWKYDSFI